jgi:hypothetical protein
MNKIELLKLASKKLNTKKVQIVKKQLCQMFIDRKQKKDCMTAFDKSFIKSFILSYQNQL